MSARLSAFLIAGLRIGFPRGPRSALLAQTLRAQSRSGGMGVFCRCYYVVMAFLPSAAGLVRDLSCTPAAPTLFAAAMVLSCVPALALFHAARKMQER